MCAVYERKTDRHTQTHREGGGRGKKRREKDKEKFTLQELEYIDNTENMERDTHSL